MLDVSEMTPADLLARAAQPVDDDRDLEALLIQCGKLADGSSPALALLFFTLSAEPPEVAASRVDQLEALAGRLHPHTDGPTLARAAARMLAQWKE